MAKALSERKIPKTISLKGSTLEKLDMISTLIKNSNQSSVIEALIEEKHSMLTKGCEKPHD